MNKKTLTTFYFIGAVIIIFGALQKILHRPSADLLLQIGFISSIIFTGFAVYEIMQSKNIELSAKILWVIGLLFMNIIIGFIYITRERQKIVAKQ